MPEPELSRLHRRVLGQLDELLAWVGDPDLPLETVTDVSRWSILDHAEHLARADAGSLHQLETALDREGGPRARMIGRLLLALGWIPRGVGKAPAMARPESSGRAAVIAGLQAARRRLEALDERLDAVAAARGRASHPIFGGLTPARWLRFLQIHHHHHLKIIRDIRREIAR